MRLFDVEPALLAKFSQFVERLHPDDRARVQQDVADALKENRPYDTDYRVTLHDGGWRDINARGHLFTDEHGKTVGMVGTCVDITERKRAEEALQASESMFRAAVEILPVGLWILDAEGKIAVSSAAAQRIWGGARYVGLGQLGTYKGWRTDSGKSVEAENWAGPRAFSKGETTVEEEVEIECFDGTHKIILDSAIPLRRSDGSICGAVTINQDITERKRAEEALHFTNDDVKALAPTAELSDEQLEGVAGGLKLAYESNPGQTTLLSGGPGGCVCYSVKQNSISEGLDRARVERHPPFAGGLEVHAQGDERLAGPGRRSQDHVLPRHDLEERLLAVRVLRPAVPMEVLTDNVGGTNGRPLSVRSLGVYAGAGPIPPVEIGGPVRAAAGPWTLEDGWRSEPPAARAYWDVELESGGLYRLFREPLSGDWFVDGVYD